MSFRISPRATLLALNAAFVILAMLPSFAQSDPCKPSFLHQFSHAVQQCDTTSKTATSKAPPKKSSMQYDFRVNLGAIVLSRSIAQTGYCKLSTNLSTHVLWKFPRRKTASEIEIRDESGAVFIPDSLIEKVQDQLRIKLSHSHKINDSARVLGSTSMVLTTEKFNGMTSYTKLNPGTVNSGFLSPGELVSSAGFKLQSFGWGHIELGLAAFKVTWVANKKLYDIQQTAVLHQVRREQKAKIDGGLSLQTQIDRRLSKQVRWESRLLLFAGVGENTSRDIEFRNEWLINPDGSFKTSLRSVYSYKKGRWPPGNLTGEFTIGMNLSKP